MTAITNHSFGSRLTYFFPCIWAELQTSAPSGSVMWIAIVDSLVDSSWIFVLEFHLLHAWAFVATFTNTHTHICFLAPYISAITFNYLFSFAHILCRDHVTYEQRIPKMCLLWTNIHWKWSCNCQKQHFRFVYVVQNEQTSSKWKERRTTTTTSHATR